MGWRRALCDSVNVELRWLTSFCTCRATLYPSSSASLERTGRFFPSVLGGCFTFSKISVSTEDVTNKMRNQIWQSFKGLLEFYVGQGPQMWLFLEFDCYTGTCFMSSPHSWPHSCSSLHLIVAIEVSLILINITFIILRFSLEHGFSKHLFQKCNIYLEQRLWQPLFTRMHSALENIFKFSFRKTIRRFRYEFQIMKKKKFIVIQRYCLPQIVDKLYCLSTIQYCTSMSIFKYHTGHSIKGSTPCYIPHGSGILI